MDGGECSGFDSAFDGDRGTGGFDVFPVGFDHLPDEHQGAAGGDEVAVGRGGADGGDGCRELHGQGASEPAALERIAAGEPEDVRADEDPGVDRLQGEMGEEKPAQESLR